MRPTPEGSSEDPSSLDLMKLYVSTCYVHDQDRCIAGVNEWSGGEAPRLWLGRTRLGSIWRWRHDLGLDARRRLDQVLRREPIAHSFPAPLCCEQEIASILESSHSAHQVVSGPVYWCRLQIVGGAKSAVGISSQQAGLMREFLEDWIPDIEHEQPMMVSTSHGCAVSVCASVHGEIGHLGVWPQSWASRPSGRSSASVQHRARNREARGVFSLRAPADAAVLRVEDPHAMHRIHPRIALRCCHRGPRSRVTW
jgi:hypothetical protein